MLNLKLFTIVLLGCFIFWPIYCECDQKGVDLRGNSTRFFIEKYEKKQRKIRQTTEDLRTTGVWVTWNKYKESVPSNAVRNNYEDHDKYYVIRAYHNGELVPGKYAINEKKAYISYGRKEHTKEHFEILTHTNYFWSDDKNDELPLIKGGYDSWIGSTSFICRVAYDGSYVGGKLINDNCFYPSGHYEHKSRMYQALRQKSWI